MVISSNLREYYVGHPYEIGPASYGGLNIADWKDRTKLKVGDYCSFGQGVRVLLGGEHHHDWVSTYPFEEKQTRTKGDITIGNDVWVGWEALILSGVTIGDGAIIGARSVVTKDIEPYSIVAGQPAKFIRYRFPVAVREKLMAIRWWDWPVERVLRAKPWLMSADVWEFILAVERGDL